MPSSKSRRAPQSHTAPDGKALPKVDQSVRARARRIYDRLLETYPDADCALTHDGPWQLLIATILSAQCTDVRVNMTTPDLFKAYPTPKALADAKPADVEKLIKSTGFYRNKAKSIQGASHAIAQEYGNKVPQSMEELLTLPGVARKTANVVLGNAFDINLGVVVDTHVARLSHRLEFTKHKDVKKIERDLMALFPQKKWTMLAHLLIHHGRALCKARGPICSQCPLNRTCNQVGVTNAK